MMVNMLASVLEFQRDMISENTRQGVAAAQTFTAAQQQRTPGN